MRILYDYQIQICQRYGGVSRYFYEIISRIRQYPDTIIDMPVLLPKSYDLAENLLGKKSFSYPYKVAEILYWINRFCIIPRLRYGKQDIIHITQYRMDVPQKTRGKVVVTVHDMIWELFPETDPTGRRRKQKKCAIDRADGIIAISETTKRDLLKIYPDLNPEKIIVIHHGVTTIASDYDKDLCKKKFGNNFVLFVGARNDYKNFYMFIKAMGRISMHDGDVRIVCTGEKPFNTREKEWILNNGLNNRIIQNKCTNGELAYLYEHARCFVFPSKYEGFGLPILEAFSKCCPVALSDTSIFREIAGDAAAYFDPEDDEKMANVINHILTNDCYRNELIHAAMNQLSHFSWDHTAHDVYRLYRGLLKA